MSEVHFHVHAQFPGAEQSARFFRAVYSHTGADAGTSIEELSRLGVDPDTFLDDEIAWEIEDCGVDDGERFRLKATAGGEEEVIAALTIAASLAGATSVLTVLFDTTTGIYQALGASGGEVLELFTTEDYDAVGDDFVGGMRRLLLRAHESVGRLVRDGLLAP